MTKLEGDHDVFGDGSVTILATPGHTPGHQSLLVKLPKTGAIVLSGDAVHFKSNWENRGVPSGNTDKDQTLASMQRIADVHGEGAGAALDQSRQGAARQPQAGSRFLRLRFAQKDSLGCAATLLARPQWLAELVSVDAIFAVIDGWQPQTRYRLAQVGWPAPQNSCFNVRPSHLDATVKADAACITSPSDIVPSRNFGAHKMTGSTGAM